MTTTKTGELTVGFREVHVLSKDFRDEITWAKQNGFGCIDIAVEPEEKIPIILENGLAVGAIDLPAWGAALSPDKSTRAKAKEEWRSFMLRCAELVKKNSPGNPLIFLALMLPEEPSLPRRENYGYMLETYRGIADTVLEIDARIVIEGYPGPGCVVSTPEGFRSFLRDCQCDSIGVNYDPSHLIRMGIDPLRFLHEFGSQTYHVHAKDTEILTEKLFEFGHEVPSIFEKSIAYGGHTWRYTIPGHGCMRWREAIRILHEGGYRGLVSIELEDANFNLGNGSGEKEGLIHSAAFLASC